MAARPKLALTVASLATALVLHAQDPDPSCAATYRLGDRERQVGHTEVALEFARRYRLDERGADALMHLVDRTLVADAAAKKGFTPTHAEVEAYVKNLATQLQSKNMSLDDVLAQKNLSRRAFERDYIPYCLAHEKLVIDAAGLAGAEEVTADLLALWLEEAKGRANVVTEAAELPPGIVARVGDRQFGMIDLGRLLYENASPKNIRHHVHQIVVREVLRHAAEQRGITVSQEELDAEVESKRQRIKDDPSFGGVAFEEILKTQGMTIADLRRSPVLRAQVHRRKLIEHEFSDTALDAHIAADRRAVLLRHGARRHLHVILLRASDPPNEFIPLSFEQALEKAKTVKRLLADGTSFATAARLHSDEPNSKVSGGDIGLHRLISDTIPKSVLDAAFHLDPFEVSDPVRTEHGWFLIMVSKIEDPPSDALLRERLRPELAQQFVVDLIKAAEVEVTNP